MSDPGGPGRRVLEEALRLVDAVQATRAPSPAGDGAPAGHQPSSCTVCPLCRAMDHLRTLDPDAVDRLTAAVTGVGLAVRDLLAADGRTAPPGPGGAPPGAEAGGDAEGGAEDEAGVDRVPVRRIDVTE